MHDKIRVNAILGLYSGEMYGKYKVYLKTAENLDDLAVFNEIPYQLPMFNIPHYDLIHKIVIYPHRVKKSLDGNADLTHIFSQEETYLLNRIDFKTPKIATCLDIIPLLSEENTQMSMKFLKYSMEGMKKADKIITISDHTKRDIIQHLDIPSEMIETVHLGVDPYFQLMPPVKLQEIRQKYNLPEKFILYVGSEQPRKNFNTVVKAFHSLKEKYNLDEMKLVKVGKPQIGESDRKILFDLLDDLNITSEVFFMDYVPEEDLPAFYNLADLFVYPSLYEGFGLPPLEAMACGTPVVTSNTSSLPEVVGDAGIMVDPLDEEALASAMHRILSDEELQCELRERGISRARDFSWQKTAQKTWKVYQEVLGEY
ncbi:glycosyltransferase family 1 protein [Methanobacterium formicicum]|uniref:Group 1 glycosyl transferase n=1 Tax=Methanobacterium formicicum (strain DSM 3637 / PP1) TaxID=1204725 RepID=K2R136_METFP|nr:glycosyltransferase family 1 protein [Methanobacterium formicicum]EKF84902.1 group 1 glycosyl transferase [Methanobacterium formicicum DSM 3637]